MEFFNFKDDGVTLKKNAFILYPTIKTILNRDKGGKIKGDPDGRLKLFAHREFTYVYFSCNFYMYPIQHGLSAKETHEYATKHALLPSDYTPDEVIKEFMKQYSKEHLSPTKRSIKNLLSIFADIDTIIEAIKNNIDLSMKATGLSSDQITSLINYQKQLLNIATEIPDQAKKLRTALTTLEEEEKQKIIGRGGEELSDSHDPNNEIENEE